MSYLERRDYENFFEYKIHKNIVKNYFSDLCEYIKNKHFGKYNKYQPYIICNNNFPYIHNYHKHLVFWVNPIYNKFYQKEENIRKIIKQLYPNSKFILFKNEIKDQSITQILHYQLFINFF